jgi:hypothetical protein
MLIRLNERFRQIFQNYLKTLSTPSTSYGGYNYGSYNYGGGYTPPSQVNYNKSTTIYFYEWSNLSNKSIVFNNVSTFKSFCSQHGVRFLEYHETTIKENNYVYATCIPGTPTLMIRNTYKELSEALEAYKKNMSYCRS